MKNLQPLLSYCELKKSDLSIYLNESEKRYHVYLGIALLECVNASPEALEHKMLIGRLYNGGARAGMLAKRFHHDPRSIKKWGVALLSNDVEDVVRAFAGRKAKTKITPDIYRYLCQQYAERHLLGREYRKVIINRANEVFGVTLGSSTVSAVFRQAKAMRNIALEKVPRQTAADPPGSALKMATGGQNTPDSSTKTVSSVQKSPIFHFMGKRPKPFGKTYVQHLGLILFAPFLIQHKGLFRQIICQILTGAVVIEQSKKLCLESVAFLFGTMIATLKLQRDGLQASSNRQAIVELYRANAAGLSDGPGKGKVFYFDPHTKKYTGQLNVLRGWCGSEHSISKIVNLDCFHTQSGRPCFIQHYSNYYDMRERFFISMEIFDQLFPENERHGRTFIIDRGIYGRETFSNFKHDWLITWEKDFDGKGWDETVATVDFVVEKKRNNSSDLRKYSFKCQESAWTKDPKFRRILAKITNPSGKTILVSILCSNPDMDIRDAVRLICNRWLQENDFKYLGRYYGIDQLDSRRSNTFEQVADKFIDRLVDSEEYKEVRKIVANAEQKMAHHLLKMKKNQDQKKECEVALEVAEASNDMPAKDVTKIRKAIMRCEQKQRKLQGKSVVLEQTMVEAVAAQERAIRKSSRKQQLIDGAYDMLDLSRKSCMDALRVNAANIFDKLHERFRANYDNYRDDHEYWRLLTRSSGNVSWDGRRVHIELWLSGTIPPRVLKAMRKTLISIEDDINRISLQPVRIAIVTGMIFQEKQGVQLDTP